MSEKNKQEDVQHTPNCGRFYGVGIGPGDPELLTRRAENVLQQVDVIFYVAGPRTRESISGGVLDSLPACAAEKVELVFSMSRDISERQKAWYEHGETVAARLEQGCDCAFVTLGDPLIYSTYGYLLKTLRERLPDLQPETVPGITSFQLAAARQNMSLVEDKEVLTVVPMAEDAVAEQDLPLEASDTLVMLKTYKSREKVLELLEQYNMTEGVYAARVGLEGELMTTDLHEVPDHPEDYLSMLIVKRTGEHG